MATTYQTYKPEHEGQIISQQRSRNNPLQVVASIPKRYFFYLFVTIMIYSLILPFAKKGTFKLENLISGDYHIEDPQYKYFAPFLQEKDVYKFNQLVKSISPADKYKKDISHYEFAKNHGHKADLVDIFKNEKGNVNSALLYGPPGTSKTFMINQIARELNIASFFVNPSHIYSNYEGDAEKNIKMIFNTIGKNFEGPLMIVFDEFEELLAPKKITLKNEFKNNMGKLLEDRKDVYLIAITNKPELMETSFVRRFKARMMMGPPNLETRAALVLNYLTVENLLKEEEELANLEHMRVLAEMSEGFSFSDLVNFVDIYVHKNKNKELDFDDLEKELGQFKPTIKQQDIVNCVKFDFENGNYRNAEDEELKRKSDDLREWYSLMVHLDNDDPSQKRIKEVKQIYDQYDLPMNLMKATHWIYDEEELKMYPLDKDKITDHNGYYRPGAYGLAGSFYKCLKHARDNDWPHLLFLEDDAVPILPKDKFYGRLDEVMTTLPDNGEGIYMLGLTVHCQTNPNDTIGWRKFKDIHTLVYGAHAVYFGKQSIHKMLNYIQENKIDAPIDVFINEFPDVWYWYGDLTENGMFRGLYKQYGLNCHNAGSNYGPINNS